MDINKKILIAAPVYQKATIFKEYLNSLNHLIIPEGYEVHKYFLLCNSPELKNFLQPDEYEIDDYKFKEEKPKGHHNFELEQYKSVALARNKILQKARKENYDYIFSVDSDVLIHPKCLEFLLKDDKDIVGMSYYQYYNNTIGKNYYYNENIYSEENIRCNFIEKGIYEVGVMCASVLIGKRIIKNEKINYSMIDSIKFSRWEDYAFSLRAHILIPDLKIFVDTRLPCRHLMSENDYNRWMKEKEEYEKFNNWRTSL